MAGTEEEDDSKDLKSNDSLFVWDETTQLFFHASSGFYHDPNAGWYYSSSDGLYYKFENGNYELLDSHQANDCEATMTDNPVQHGLSEQIYCYDENHASVQPDESEAYQCMESIQHEQDPGHKECTRNQTPENPPPPSEWLEETLIDLYLSGYNQGNDTANGEMMPLGTDEGDNFKFSADGNSDSLELEEGEWIPEDDHGLTHSSEGILDEGVSCYSWDEDNWRSQYGQVIRSEEEPVLAFPVIDLWDWAMVTECRKDGKDQVARLVGHKVRRSVKLHPSMPSGRRLLKTAPIREVHIDLVRVTTGQVYKLRSPSAKYLASLSSYDSSNPTKDWGFPEFFPQSEPIQKSKSDSSTLPDQLPASEKHQSHAYRDRAAERRTLHGGFGVGPGQKRVFGNDDDRELSSVSTSTEEAAAEALNMSFGTGSYARRMLESMGWKEGEALGSTTEGLVEPIQAIGNIGSAGLGWPQGRRPKPKH
ncbi:hypothetical protein EZV62_022750 [Acer yangbiense]|uniref:G-patch domain-containing protein n=1 Tax=Acer yangbiense TaxID=1000413 RepID=A0A5C7H1P2_9ROSI|nr:hypothetical protein EZV62_022750 [Acer yangbiense]